MSLTLLQGLSPFPCVCACGFSPSANVILLINATVEIVTPLTLINDHEHTAFSQQYCRLQKLTSACSEASVQAILPTLSNSTKKTFKCQRENAFKRSVRLLMCMVWLYAPTFRTQSTSKQIFNDLLLWALILSLFSDTMTPLTVIHNNVLLKFKAFVLKNVYFYDFTYTDYFEIAASLVFVSYKSFNNNINRRFFKILK